MKKSIKSLLAITVILVITICCFTACDIIDDILGNDNDGDVQKGECHHEFEQIDNTANCMHDGDVVLECKMCGYIERRPIGPTTHTAVAVPAVPADCYNPGWTEGSQCSVCGTMLTQPQQTAPEHQYEVIAAVEPTCTTDGHTEGEKCTICGNERVSSYTIPASHSLEYYIGKEATCTEKGYTNGEKCQNCDYISWGLVEIPAEHDIVEVSGYSATCTEDGLTVGEKCSRCDYVEVAQQVIPAAHTNIDTTEGYPATCTQAGLTDGEYCYDCNTPVSVQTEIPKKGHTSKTVAGYAATCTSVGLSDGAVCEDCGMILAPQYNIISGGHKYGTDGKCEGCDLQVTPELTYKEGTPFVGATTGYIVTGIDSGFEGTVIVIPDQYNGAPVVGIDAGAFANSANIEKVVIPDTVEHVGSGAFNGCAALEIVECSDFAQMTDWDSDWFGDAEIKLTAVFNQGKTPYEIYIEAMNSTGHNYTNYTWSSTSNTYATSYPGLPSGYLVMSQSAVQKQDGNNFYYSQSETDYMSGGTTISSSFYFVNGYFYQYYNNQWMSVPMSFEYWCGTMAMNTASIKLLPEHFRDVTFYKDTDGKMYLELVLDEELFTQLIEESSGTELGMEVLDPVYQYVFTADGYIESYGFTGSVGGVFEIVSESKFENIDSTSFTAPYATAYSAPTCYSHNVIEVEAVAPTCYANGTSAYSYCKTCYQAITAMQTIPASHHYENGECVDCGTFYDPNMSIGLAYTVNEAGDGYVVVGIGACQDTTVYIPTHIYGLPVTEVKADAFANTAVEYIVIDGYTYSISEFTGWKAQ